MSTSMCMVKKHAIGPQPSTVATISTNGFFLLDTHTDLRFLIDAGACRSLLPKSKVHSGCITGTDTNLIAANGSRILTYGYNKPTKPCNYPSPAVNTSGTSSWPTSPLTLLKISTFLSSSEKGINLEL